MTNKFNEIDAKQGRNGMQVAFIVIVSMIILGFVGWIAMFATAA